MAHGFMRRRPDYRRRDMEDNFEVERRCSQCSSSELRGSLGKIRPTESQLPGRSDSAGELGVSPGSPQHIPTLPSLFPQSASLLLIILLLLNQARPRQGLNALITSIPLLNCDGFDLDRCQGFQLNDSDNACADDAVCIKASRNLNTW